MPLQHNILRPMPITILHRRLQIRPMVTIEVGEDAVLVLQTAMVPDGGSVVLNGREGAGGRALDAERPGEGGGRGSRRSRYHLGRAVLGRCWVPIGGGGREKGGGGGVGEEVMSSRGNSCALLNIRL